MSSHSKVYKNWRRVFFLTPTFRNIEWNNFLLLFFYRKNLLINKSEAIKNFKIEDEHFHGTNICLTILLINSSQWFIGFHETYLAI